MTAAPHSWRQGAAAMMLFAMLLPAAQSLAAQPGAAPTGRDWQIIKGTLRAQLIALRAGDAAGAFAHTIPSCIN